MPDCGASRFLSGKCGGTSRWVSIIGGIALGVMLMTCGGLFFCLIRRRSSVRAERSTKRLISEATGSIRIPIHPYREIEKATSGFSDKRRLGTGAYGTVYSGKLQNDEWVAIKRIKRTYTDSMEQVMNEIKLLSSVSHPNLVRLLGCSIEKGEQILVYEFMPNGTLAEQLQGTRGHGLPWATRLNIATETARAISYLHSHDPPIFHRDIKSSNILLDYNLKSKVADFGLSRLGEVEFSHISTAPQGTPGYLDPQYHQNFQLSDKSDVYSFGVVLVEIITGLKAVDFSRHQDEVNLASLVIDRIGKGRLDEIIDPFLEPQSDPWILSSIHKVAELAFRCLTYHRDMRPTMSEVLEELEQIRIARFLESDERYFSTSASNRSSSYSSSSLSEKPLCIVIKSIAAQNNRTIPRWMDGNDKPVGNYVSYTLTMERRVHN
uniref:Protein kinase domain-containing protein n=1 Tax=Kalanchoe fedtschenkoi TaxID=63787 RepID=A0A7N0TR88_KALFE